ncbi:MAG: DegT/DnrJ/EryC1/StrS family aminotransferase, partial [Candidatus Angelobacter sp.]
AGRQRNAKKYDQLFASAGLSAITPKIVGSRHIFNQYVIRVERRNELQSNLQKKGIGTEVYYPVPMHLQECFAYLGVKPGAFPESERAAGETLALPVYPEVSEQQLQYVAECVTEFVRAGSAQGSNAGELAAARR